MSIRMFGKYIMLVGASMVMSSMIVTCAYADRDEAAYVNDVKITMVDALQKAVEFHEGVPISVELEKDRKGLFYDIEMIIDGEEVDVLVNADTGVMIVEDDDRRRDDKE